MIAKDLGITQMAVSKALRGHKDISAETRRRVLARADELNYRVNLTAVALRSRQNQLVGIVVPTFLHSFFSDLIEGAGATAGGAGLPDPGGHHRRGCRAGGAPDRGSGRRGRWMA